MSHGIKQLITKLNAAHEKSEDTESPVNQIVQILNAHLNSLQWIDQNTATLHSRIEEASKQFTVRKREQERLYGSSLV